MRIALYQMHIEWEDKQANMEKVEAKLRALAEAQHEPASEAQQESSSEKQIDVLLLPEMSFTGFSMNTDTTKEEKEETIEKMKLLAKQYNIAIGFGWVKDCSKEDCSKEYCDKEYRSGEYQNEEYCNEHFRGKKAENHYTIVDKTGECISDYAKIHPFSFAGEDLKFQGGEEITSFWLEGVPCSNFICYDLRFPEIFQIASKTANMIIVPANWPAKRSSHWKALLQARAIENQVYIIAINCVGQMDNLYYSGDSCVINPDGQVLDMLSDEEGLIIYDFADDVETYRSSFPVKQDRREDLYYGIKSQSTT